MTANMTAGASSSSSSKAITPKYEVFLSFRGEDTRYGFVSHLYAALCRNKVKTYIDDNSLPRGHEISESLMQAIQESRVSVVVFSEKYASSLWCLDELVHILRCKERNGQIVVPVFYRVEPTHIRKQQGSFGQAFSILEERFKGRSVDQVNEWRLALSAAADLSGWDSSVFRSEAELVEKIVEDVINKLNSRPARLSDYYKGLVGIEEQAKEIETLLSVGTSGIRIIGIWGMGGIGKTTLATVVFNQLSSQFRGRCFVANVREEWTKGRKEELQKKLFSKLLEEENPYNAWERLCNTKALIVLGDVNDQDQLEYLIEDGRDSFGDGSRIIVTTRDMQMLRYIGADATYEVKVLNHDEALELFLLNAFKGNHPTSSTGYIKIAERVVNYAKGIPLVLKVLGSFLRCKAQENWESELNELEQALDEKIQNVLKVSNDQLNKKDQQIFLDIACFFDWTDRDYAEEFWTACGFDAKTKVDNLIEKSLLNIRDSDTLWMHDLIKEMGRKILSSIEELGRRSRLWKAEDVIHVLKNNMGTEAIEGIFLENFDPENIVYLGPAVFEGMSNLKFLKVKCFDINLKFSQGLNSLPTALRYLEWHSYPFKSLPSEFSPRNLVEIHMPHSRLEKLWDGVQHDLGNLKRIDLSFSHHLTQIPDLCRALKLERLSLTNCESLAEVPDLSFSGHLTPILDLSHDYFHQFRQLLQLNEIALKLREKQKLLRQPQPQPQPLGKRRKPGTLDLAGCYCLKLVGNISGNLQYIRLRGSAVEELPSSIGSLDNLISLNLENCKLIKNIPRSIRNLKSLKHLSLCGCSSISKFPENIPGSIVVLDLSGTYLTHVPPSIKHVTCLEEFCLDNCISLLDLPTSICELKYLRSLYLYGCSSLKKFPEILEPMECFRTLDLRRTGITEIPVSFQNLVELRNLHMERCSFRKFVSDCVIRTPSLNVKVPDWLGCLSTLEILSLEETYIYRLPPSIKDLSRLIKLNVRDCLSLQALPELPLSLAILDARGCRSLKTVSSSKTLLVQGHWSDYQITYYKQFLFCDCSNLDPIAWDNIMIDSQIRILRTAAISLSQPKEISRVFDEKPFVGICCWGNEIPIWFLHQSDIPSINIDLPPNWHNNFIGFALCAVVGCINDFMTQHVVECEYYFKTSNGKSPKFLYPFQEPRKMHLDSRVPRLNFDHVLMWYNYKEYHDYLDAVEVSFEFPSVLKRFDGQETYFWFHSVKIRRWGVRLLCLQDAEEFGIVDMAKPNVDATVDQDTYGPHTKRPSFSNSH